jgi:hypothetical protein
MHFNAQSAIAEIDAILSEYEGAKSQYTKSFWSDNDRATISYLDCPEEVESHLTSLMLSALRRLALDEAFASEAAKRAVVFDDCNRKVKVLVGALTALRSDYQAGRVRTFRERVHSDMFLLC